MKALPFVDELSASCTAPAGRLWQSLVTSLPRSSSGGSILARVPRLRPGGRHADLHRNLR